MKRWSLAPLRAKNWLYLRVGVATLLLVVLFVSVGVDPVVDCFKTIDLRFVGIITLFLVLLVLLGSLNVWLILNAIHVCPFRVFLRSYLSSWATGLITPGQAGDASMVLFLKGVGVPLRCAATAYMIDKMITLVYFLGIAWYGSCVLMPSYAQTWKIVLFAAVLLGLCVYGAVRLLPARTWSHMPLWGSVSAIASECRRFRAKWPVLAINIVITTVKWLVLAACYHTAFLAFGVEAGWPAIAVIPILATLVGYIPASVAGIGTVEVTAVYLFGAVGVGQGVVLSSYLLVRCLQYLLASVSMLGGLGRTREQHKWHACT